MGRLVWALRGIYSFVIGLGLWVKVTVAVKVSGYGYS